MLFQTFDFLLFFVPVALAAWALVDRPRARMGLLLAASYFFYMAGPKTDPPPAPWYYVGLLLASTVLDFVCAREIFARRAGLDAAEPAVRRRATTVRRAWFLASLGGNLSLLGWFKYTNFLLGAFADLGHLVGVPVERLHLDLLLPVGISFYTFQSLSYTIDVWRGRLEPEPSFLRFALFVVFFPQLVAGPIVRASEFLPQLRVRPRVSAAALEEGLFRIFKGLVKKIVFGDLVAARLADPVFAGPGDYSQLEILVALYAFTLQMYADFSAYSDLAIGIARLLGYTLPENFDRPYQARNVGEFWRRWHMTLSTWLRDYLFFPLGGSQGSALRTYFNLWLTMFLVGMWHGASWNFVVYGNLHALAIVFNRWNRLRAARSGVVAVLHTLLAAAAMAAVFGLAARGLLRLEDDAATVLAAVAAVSTLLVMWVPEGRGRAVTLLHVALTFHFTVLSRVFFRAEDLDASRELAAGLLRFDGLGLRPGGTEPVVWAALLIGFAVHFAPRRLVDEVGLRWFRRLPGPVLGALFCLLALGLTHLLSGAPRAFIYFQF